MTTAAPNTDRLLDCPPPPVERLDAALMAAHPGGPGELVLRVYAGGRLLDLAFALSAGDGPMLAAAVAAVPDRGTGRVSRADTVRTRPAD